MADRRQRFKGRRSQGPFLALPKAVLASAAYRSLSAYGVKLMVDLGEQFNGANNGDLQASWAVLKDRGWRSKATLHAATHDLLRAGLIEETRRGGLNLGPTLFAFTWLPIDEVFDRRTKRSKLDVGPTAVASGKWKQPAPTPAKNGRTVRNVDQTSSLCVPAPMVEPFILPGAVRDVYREDNQDPTRSSLCGDLLYRHTTGEIHG